MPYKIQFGVDAERSYEELISWFLLNILNFVVINTVSFTRGSTLFYRFKDNQTKNKLFNLKNSVIIIIHL